MIYSNEGEMIKHRVPPSPYTYRIPRNEFDQEDIPFARVTCTWMPRPFGDRRLRAATADNFANTYIRLLLTSKGQARDTGGVL